MPSVVSGFVVPRLGVVGRLKYQFGRNIVVENSSSEHPTTLILAMHHYYIAILLPRHLQIMRESGCNLVGIEITP